MNKNELSVLLMRCPNDSPLFAVAQEASRRLNAAVEVKIVIGEPQPCADLLKTYTARWHRATKKGLQVIGLEETVNAFDKSGGSLIGGYADIGGELIYFWFDEKHNLTGCLL